MAIACLHYIFYIIYINENDKLLKINRACRIATVIGRNLMDWSLYYFAQDAMDNTRSEVCITISITVRENVDASQWNCR